LKRLQVCISALLVASLLSGISSATAKVMRVRINRWLEVQQLSGNVLFSHGDYSRPAQVGTRLQHVGDTIHTGERASTTLAVDTGVGFVNVSSNTVLRLQHLEETTSGGRLTRLKVLEGQARFQVKKLKDSDSELEIQTPAGSSAVRGTEFGVSVHPDGKTGVVTSEGSVVTSAQGKMVTVNAGYQSFLIPGEPPSDPVPAKDDAELKLRFLAETNQQVHVIGRVDPVNLLWIEEKRQVVDRNGQFDLKLPLPSDRRIQAVVMTPLGKREQYELAVP
jgi:hypothetical protein